MASSVLIQSSSLFLLLLSCFISLCNAQASSTSRPKGIILPITKDASTLQYLTQIKQGTPLLSKSLVVHLGAEFLWVDCGKGYVSSTNRSINCFSNPCKKLNPRYGPGTCTKGKRAGYRGQWFCRVSPRNDVSPNQSKSVYGSGDLSSDVVSVQSFIDVSKPGPNAKVRRFTFGCGSTSLLQGLARGVKGIASFGRSELSLPSQFASAFRIPRIFAVCLPSVTASDSKGAMVFGGGPYDMPLGNDISKQLTYTPLKINPNDPAEYNIQVKAITIDGKQVPIGSNLSSKGFGWTKISTVIPYTIMHTSIYKSFTRVFIEKAKGMNNITQAAPVAPFGVCFSDQNIWLNRLGPIVPQIDLVMHKADVIWSLFGSNSMVRVNDDVLCLAFVDGGMKKMDSAIVIGGYQMEENLLEFNLAKSSFGFKSSLLGIRSCSSLIQG
ncbi:hypothetical protein MKX01_014736 [Papaver californicum]|nr:hypothetical protein MKX01_014736 [Papaver californicum]